MVAGDSFAEFLSEQLAPLGRIATFPSVIACFTDLESRNLKSLLLIASRVARARQAEGIPGML